MNMPSISSIDHYTVRLKSLLAPLLVLVLALIEWLSWSPHSSFLRSVLPGLGEKTSFCLAIALLILSLIGIAGMQPLRLLLQHYAFLKLGHKPVVRWSPAGKMLAGLLPPLLLALSASILLIRAIPVAISDLSAAAPALSLAYFLILASILLSMVRIPGIVQPKLEKGVLSIGRYACYEVLDVAGLVVYVFREHLGQWALETSSTLVVKGEQVILFDPAFRMLFTHSFQLSDNPAFHTHLELTVAVNKDSFPNYLTAQDSIRLIQSLSTETAAPEKKQWLQAAAAKLGSSMDLQLRSIFGISEQGQFQLDTVAGIVKGDVWRALNYASRIDLGNTRRQLEKSYTDSLFGRPCSSPVCSIDLHILSLELKQPFVDLNETLTALNTCYNQGITMRKKLTKKLTALYARLCPSADPQEIASRLHSLLIAKPARIFEPDRNRQAEPVQPGSISVNDSGELQLPVWEDERVSKAARDLAEIGRWLAALPDLEQRLADFRIGPELYAKLREKNLIGNLPPLRKNALVFAMEKTLHLETSQLTDPNSRLYTDGDYRLSIASRIVHKN